MNVQADFSEMIGDDAQCFHTVVEKNKDHFNALLRFYNNLLIDISYVGK